MLAKKKKSIVGLDIGSSALKAVELRPVRALHLRRRIALFAGTTSVGAGITERDVLTLPGRSFADVRGITGYHLGTVSVRRRTRTERGWLESPVQ